MTRGQAFVWGALACSACASELDPPFSGGGGTGAGGHDQAAAGSGSSRGGGGAGGTGGGFPEGGGGHPPIDDCSPLAHDIYLVTIDSNLYRFHPDTLEAELLGSLDCISEAGDSPQSMAVDREGIAWILTVDRRIYRVDTATLACTPTTFDGFAEPIWLFGMGFALDGDSGPDETLYIADALGSGLATLDTTTMHETPLGPYDGEHGYAELTGTGNGRLFGFFPQYPPAKLIQLDKSDAHAIEITPLPARFDVASFAFAAWGGSFWFFVSHTVTKYDPTTGDATVVVPDLGAEIIGAGVSTCAPAEPPR